VEGGGCADAIPVMATQPAAKAVIVCGFISDYPFVFLPSAQAPEELLIIDHVEQASEQ
jgi:hypothetical protein